MKTASKLLLGALLMLGLCHTPATAYTITVQPEYEQTIIAPDSSSVHVVIRFRAQPAPQITARAPMSLALVIDRSGSMSEAGKLSYAKMAARDLVNRLNEKDFLSLVVYDTNVEVLMPLSKMTRTNQAKVLRLIDELRPSSATNLSGGMQAGVKQIAKADTPGVKRVILLSDGLANQGETMASRIAALAAQSKRGGVSITAMGLGEDYDEDLMQLIAQRGGGNYYYIRNPEDSSRFFASELKGVLAGVSKNITLELVLGEGVRDVKVYGYNLTGSGRNRQVDISDFYADEERMMVIEYQLKPLSGDALSLGDVRLNYESLPNGGKPELQDLPLAVKVSANKEAQEASVNKDAKVEVLALQSDEKYAAAVTAVSEGRYEEASRIVAQTESEIKASAYASGSAVLADKQRALLVERQRIAAMPAAPAAEQQDFVKQARNRIYNASQGKMNMQRMSLGSQGLEVELLQNALAKQGLYKGPIDGNYSAEVETAVKTFQKNNHLTVDGVAGPETQNAMGLF